MSFVMNVQKVNSELRANDNTPLEKVTNDTPIESHYLQSPSNNLTFSGTQNAQDSPLGGIAGLSDVKMHSNSSFGLKVNQVDTQKTAV